MKLVRKRGECEAKKRGIFLSNDSEKSEKRKINFKKKESLSSMSSAFLKHSDGFNFIKVVQRLQFHIPEKDISLDKVRKESLGLIRYMSCCWDSENII